MERLPHRFTRAGLLLGTLLALTLAGTLRAQEAHELEETIVTAGRIDGPLHEAPFSAVVVDRTRIEATAPANVADILRTIPGVLVRDYGDRGMVELSLRGVGAPYGSRYVTVLVDGFPIGQGASGWIDWTVIAPENVERVEVLKGPFSALYGSQAVGGVIHIITRSGRSEPHTEASFQYGSYDALRAAARAGREMGPVSFNLSGVYTRGDGYRENSGWQDFTFFSKLEADLGTRSSLRLIGSWTRQEVAYPGPLTLEQARADPRQTSQPGAGAKIPFRYLVGAQYERLLWSFAELGLRTYAKGRRGAWNDVGLAFDTRDNYTVGNEILLTSRFRLLEHGQVFVLGFLFELDHEHLDLYLAPGGERVSQAGGQTYRQQAASFFLQGRFRISRRLLVEPGARLDLYDFRMRDELKSHSPTLLTSLAMSGMVPPDVLGWLDNALRRPGDLSKDTTLQRVSPRLSLSYHATEGLDLFVNYGEGYKAPWPALLINNPALTPEFARSAELGFRSRLLGDRLSVHGALYYTRVKDGIVMVQYNTARNLSETVHQGLEIELAARLPYDLSAFLGYAYQRARYRKTVIPPMLPGLPETTYEGGRVPLVPAHTVSAGASYLHPRGFRADLTARYVDGQYIDLANTRRLASAFLLGAKATVPVGPLRLWASAENLLDETYFEYAYLDAVAVPLIGPITMESYYPMPGRTFSVGLRMAF